MPLESAGDGFDQWAEKVRDPATRASEGKRFIRVKDAEASYEIGPLPDGRFAIKVRYAYHCGDTSTGSTPWIAFETREACLSYFLEGARHHFGERPYISSGAQEKAQKRMASLLQGIVLFVEPLVEKPDPAEEEKRKESAARLQAQRAATKRRLQAEFPLFAAEIELED